MARDTSIDIYYKVLDEGLLTGLRLDLWDFLRNHEPMTQMETCKAMNSTRQDRSIMPRFAELKKMKAIKEVDKRKCKVTGREVYVWTITDNVPIPLETKKKKKEKCYFCNGKGFTDLTKERD